MSKQKFQKGDLVEVDEDLGSTMRHFDSGCNAIVIGSYADQYGGSNTSSYTLYIKDKGRVSWYNEYQLTLIEEDCLDLLEDWKREKKAKDKRKSNLDWIFNNGERVLENGYGPSISRLAKEFGVNNLWGNNGEGFTYYMNAIRILKLSEPYLKAGDKEGFLTFTNNNI